MSFAVHLHRIDRARNMARFYAVTIQPTLFGEWALVREWGRIGQGGRVASTAYPSSAEAEAALQRIQRQKGKKGYLPHCCQSSTPPMQQVKKEACTQIALLPSCQP